MIIEIFASLSVLAFLRYVFTLHRRQRNLPPGPKGLPLIGNILDIPKEFSWETYANWGKQFDSDIIYVNAVGVSMVILNSHTVAKELLDKRSAIYSSRWVSTMANDLMGWGWLAAAMPYGEAWRDIRRLFSKHIHPSNINIYRPHQLKYNGIMLQQLLDSPKNFLHHTRNMVGAMTISMAYGISVRPVDDPYINNAEKAIAGLSKAFVPGAFLVDIISFLKHVPEWFPGAQFKTLAKEWREDALRMLNAPFEAAQKDYARGTVKESFTSLCLDELEDAEDVERARILIRDTAGQIFVAGADTTVSAINTFILAMVCYPDVQMKAQKELDSIVKGRLPDYNDEPHLPYLRAVITETLRWQPIFPLGIPHLVTEDDEYSGFCIPANSMIISNEWAMLHNEQDFPEPKVFNPERFIKDGQYVKHGNADPEEIVFGYGRRLCAGKHIAMSTIWLTAASILSVFDIRKAVDKNGVAIEPKCEIISHLVLHPVPFLCSIKPRSNEAEILIRSAYPRDL